MDNDNNDNNMPRRHVIVVILDFDTGIKTYPGGAIFIGDTNANGTPCGFGTMIFNDTLMRRGWWFNGAKRGNGEWTTDVWAFRPQN